MDSIAISTNIYKLILLANTLRTIFIFFLKKAPCLAMPFKEFLQRIGNLMHMRSFIDHTGNRRDCLVRFGTNDDLTLLVIMFTNFKRVWQIEMQENEVLDHVNTI
jgi:hypothetical protein